MPFLSFRRGPAKGDPASPQRRVLRHSAWLFAAQVVTAVLMLAQGLILARALGVAPYGAWALVTTYVLTVNQFFDCRVWEALIKFVPEYRARGQGGKVNATVRLCFAVQVVTGVVSCLVAVLTASPAARWLLKDPGSAPLFSLFAAYAILNIPYEPTSALLRVADQFDSLAIHRVVVAGARTAAIIVVWLVGPTVTRMLIAHLAGTVAGLPLLAVYGRRAGRHLGLSLRSRGEPPLTRREYLAQARFIGLTSLIATSRIVSSRADNLVLALFATPAAVGLYDVARRAVLQLNSLSGALYEAIFPEVSRLVATGALDNLRTLIRQVSFTVLVAVVPFCLVVTLAAPHVVVALFGEPYRAAAPLLQILVWQLLWLPLLWFPGFLLTTDRAGLLMRLTGLDSLILLVLLGVLVPALGATGAALSSTAHQLIWCGLVLALVRRGGGAVSLQRSA